MNLQFKEERRVIKPFHVRYLKGSRQKVCLITSQYWDLCEQFNEMMDYKREENLKRLSNLADITTLLENIKSEVDYDMHCAVGLGNRMPIPDMINGNYEKAA
jgi:hypothetical protein